MCYNENVLHCNFYQQQVKQHYEKWSADSTTLEMCRFNGDPSPVIELDQQEQEVGSWKILPLAPPRVSGSIFL